MKIIIALLCLGLVGCTTATKKDFIPVGQKELDNMVSIFSEAIKNKPNYAGAYYNRAVAYYYKKDYDKSWQDVHKVEELSAEFDQSLAKLIGKLRKASGRNK